MVLTKERMTFRFFRFSFFAFRIVLLRSSGMQLSNFIIWCNSISHCPVSCRQWTFFLWRCNVRDGREHDLGFCCMTKYQRYDFRQQRQQRLQEQKKLIPDPLYLECGITKRTRVIQVFKSLPTNVFPQYEPSEAKIWPRTFVVDHWSDAIACQPNLVAGVGPYARCLVLSELSSILYSILIVWFYHDFWTEHLQASNGSSCVSRGFVLNSRLLASSISQEVIAGWILRIVD